MIIFSYDVGQKSLGFSIVEYFPPDELILKIRSGNFTLSEIKSWFENCVQILHMEVFDLAPKKKISEISLVEMTRNLVKILDDLKSRWAAPDLILIEKQFQFKGNCSTMAQLVMYYCGGNVELIDPRRKNMLRTKNVNYEMFAEEKSKYAANKNG